MSNPGHDELLAAAVAAHRAHVESMERTRAARSRAFMEALRGTVTGRELAQTTGLSESMVSKIKAGRY